MGIENGEALVTSNGAGVPKFEVAEAGIPARAPATGITYRGENYAATPARLNRNCVISGTGRPVAPFALPDFHAVPAISR